MKALNQVEIRANLRQNAEIFQASNRLFLEVRCIKIGLYFAAFIPLFFSFFVTNPEYILICSSASLFLTILVQILETGIGNKKEQAILVNQLYEANITNTIFSKIEYDRETTNEVYELAHRKSKEKKLKLGKRRLIIPDNIQEKFAYLYMARSMVAKDRFLLLRTRIVYMCLMFIAAAGIVVSFFDKEVSETINKLVCFWPVITPLIHNFLEAGESIKFCVKVSADIDNFFAEHDRSTYRLERFNYYIQALCFEYREKRILLPFSFNYIYKSKLRTIQLGVCERFLQAIYDFEGVSTLGKMKNSAFVDAEIKTLDAIGSKYDINAVRNDSNSLNLVITKTNAARLKEKEIEYARTQKLIADKQKNKALRKLAKENSKSTTSAKLTSSVKTKDKINKRPSSLTTEKKATSTSTTLSNAKTTSAQTKKDVSKTATKSNKKKVTIK